MSSWFEDPKQLVRSDKVLEFWPTNFQTATQRVNAGSRFIIYATCIHYLIKRDPRIFVLGATALGVLYTMERAGMIKNGAPIGTEYYENGNQACQTPTADNPMANVLMGDDPMRPSACDYSTVKADAENYLVSDMPFGPMRSRSTLPEYQKNAFSRQFVTSPVSKIPGDQTAFAEWLYGKKNAPMCKTDGSVCNPNARGVQLEAFAGLDPNGDKRSGMHGFTHA